LKSNPEGREARKSAAGEQAKGQGLDNGRGSIPATGDQRKRRRAANRAARRQIRFSF
jgi:hypothetical protein